MKRFRRIVGCHFVSLKFTRNLYLKVYWKEKKRWIWGAESISFSLFRFKIWCFTLCFNQQLPSIIQHIYRRKSTASYTLLVQFLCGRVTLLQPHACYCSVESVHLTHSLEAEKVNYVFLNCCSCSTWQGSKGLVVWFNYVCFHSASVKHECEQYVSLTWFAVKALWVPTLTMLILHILRHICTIVVEELLWKMFFMLIFKVLCKISRD